MKKLITLLLVCIFMVLLVSCNSDSSNLKSTTEPSTTTTETVPPEDVFKELKDVTEIEITQYPGEKKCTVKNQKDIENILKFFRDTDITNYIEIEPEESEGILLGNFYFFSIKYSQNQVMNVTWAFDDLYVNDVRYAKPESSNIDECLKEIPECAEKLELLKS